MRNILLFFLFCPTLFSCQNTGDVKGESIPPYAIYLNKQDPAKVIAFTSQLLEEQVNSSLFYLRAKAYYDLHAYKKAYLDINKALEIVPSDLDYLFLSAQIKFNLELYQEALEDAHIVESAGVHRLSLWNLLAQIHLFLHRPALVQFYIQKSNKEGISNEYYKIQMANSRLAFMDSLSFDKRYFVLSDEEGKDPLLHRLQLESNMLSMPAIMFQSAILTEMKKYPLDPHLLRIWARFLVKIGKHELADQVYQQVNVQFVDNFKFRFELAQFYMRIRNYPKALAVLETIPLNFLQFNEVLWLKSLLWGYMGNKTANLAVLDSGIQLFSRDYRFLGAKNRLLGKKIDSTQVMQDSLSNVPREF